MKLKALVPPSEEGLEDDCPSSSGIGIEDAAEGNEIWVFEDEDATIGRVSGPVPVAETANVDPPLSVHQLSCKSTSTLASVRRGRW